MTDPWARPTGDRPAVEIELTEVAAPRRPAPPPPPPSGWPSPAGSAPVPAPAPTARRGRSPRAIAAGVAVLGVGIAAAVMVSSSGDDTDIASAPSTSLDTSLITTPPTLAPPTTAPLPTTLAPVLPTAPATVPPVDLDLVTTRSFPEADAAADVAAADGTFDLLTAAAANATPSDDARSHVTLRFVDAAAGNDGTLSIAIERDVDSGLDLITVGARPRGGIRRVEADRATGESYITTTGGDQATWERHPPGSIVEGSGTDDVAVLLDSLVSGPIIPAVLAGARIEPHDGLVSVTTGATSVARRFDVTVDVSALESYGPLLFAGYNDRSIDLPLPQQLTFEVYVDASSALSLVTTRIAAGDVVQVIEQTFDRRPADVTVDLPPADRIVEVPADGG